MRLSFVELSGFRGYRGSLRIDFADDVTIIDGRNGVGKSTIFDAIEFALTGELSKYAEAKAHRESVSDYIWWAGDGGVPEKRFVEVGFTDGDGEASIRRTPLGSPDQGQLQRLSERLCDLTIAPTASIAQLCTTSIIRDEQITSLSLDMGETDRYTLLRDALGASDAEKWITRAAELMSAAKKRTSLAEREVTAANGELSNALRRLDEARASISSDASVTRASAGLRAFTGTEAAADQLLAPARERIAKARSEINELLWLASEWPKVAAELAREVELRSAVTEAEQRALEASNLIASLPAADEVASLLSQTESVSRDLAALANLGRRLGLHEEHCPLCAARQTSQEYEAGLLKAEERARSLDATAAEIVKRQEIRKQAETSLAVANRLLVERMSLLTASRKATETFEQRRSALGVSPDAKSDDVGVRVASLRASVEAAEVDLRVVETLRFNQLLEGAQRAETSANSRVEKAQERFGKARKAEAGAAALHDAARRAAAETLDRRLERVLPLMAELYRRLRPHPVWSDLEYSIRGDVRRFLKLQVGDGLNPQFMFSSGQRRATGLAFLISVNLSLAWSRWTTILLDDPVQHIDDFRSVHLAEVLSQLVAEGRQIVCAVEDPALADMIGRRLPIGKTGSGKRITLGANDEGELSIREERVLQPLPTQALVPEKYLQAG